MVCNRLSWAVILRISKEITMVSNFKEINPVMLANFWTFIVIDLGIVWESSFMSNFMEISLANFEVFVFVHLKAAPGTDVHLLPNLPWGTFVS